jgi:hypothetical protein
VQLDDVAIGRCEYVHVVVVIMFKCLMLIHVVALVFGPSWVVSVYPHFVAPIL